MEGAVGLGGIWCHKEKELCCLLCLLGWGVWNRVDWGPGPSTPRCCDGQQCFSVWRCVVPRLLPCSPAFDGAFGEGAWELGDLFPPPHSTWLDFGWEASGPLLS